MREKTNTAPVLMPIIDSIAHHRLGWELALSELIDNALDAKATEINVVYRPKSKLFKIRDNGHGTDDPGAIVALGRHEGGGTTIGRYGVGANHALLWIGGVGSTVKIRTIFEGVERAFSASWDEIVRDEVENSANLRTGSQETVIEAQGCVRRSVAKSAQQRIVEKLGFRYHEALRNGLKLTISLNGKPAVDVRPHGVPLREPIPRAQTKIVLDENRSALVDIGITKEGESNPHAGISYIYEGRVIVGASTHGLSKTACVSSIFGTVCLVGKGWGLATHKDDLENGGELYKRVEEFCEACGIFAAAERAKKSIQADALTRMMETGLNDPYKQPRKPRVEDENDRKGRRGPVENPGSGTVEPTGTGSPHQNFTKDQPGNKPGTGGRRKRIGSELTFEFGRLGADTVGRAEDTKVILNLDIPMIERARRANDVGVLLTVAFQLIAQDDAFGEAKEDRWRKWVIPQARIKDVPPVEAFQAVLAKLMTKQRAVAQSKEGEQ